MQFEFICYSFGNFMAGVHELEFLYSLLPDYSDIGMPKRTRVR